MNPRTQEIFKAVVEEYIKHGQPISSGFLADDLGFDASPATLRNELLNLEELGFLEKPHTSAGRMPTPRGYRFFVDNLLTHEIVAEAERDALSQCKKFFQLQEFLADATRSLVLGGENIGDIREAGLLRLLQEPEFSAYDFLLDFVKKAEQLRAEFDDIFLLLKDQGQNLFIGEEAKHILGDTRYSLLLSPVDDEGFVMFFSPTRMDYAKALAFAEFLNQ